MGMWEKGVTIPAKQIRNVGGMLHGTCPGLVEGNEYVFRIKAVNKGGPSLPSPQSESMIAKTRFSKCKNRRMRGKNGWENNELISIRIRVLFIFSQTIYSSTWNV